MAATVARLIVDLTARTVKFERGLKRAERRIERTARRFRDIGTKFSTAISLPLAVVGGAALKAAINFESAFAGVRKTVNATEAEFAKLRSGILEMSQTLPASANEIAGVAEAAGQLGISTKNILEFTKTMVDLGETTNLSAREAAVALARFANITQLPQDQLDQLGSSLVELGNNTATTEAEILEMGLRLAGTGKIIGLTEAQILGLAASLSAVGVNAQAGGTSMSKTMIQISKAVKGGGRELDRFALVAGKSAADFKRQFEEDAAGGIISFIEGLRRMGKEGKDVFIVLETLGLGERRVTDALLRAAAGVDSFRKNMELSTAAFKENIALTEEAEKRYATTAAALSRLRNRVTKIAIEFGGKLVPVLEKMVTSLEPLLMNISALVGKFAALEPATQQFIVQIGLIAIALGPVLIVLGSLASVLGGLIGVFGTVVGAIISGLGSLAFVFSGFIGVFGTVVSAVISGMGSLASVFSGLIGVFGTVVGAVTSGMGLIKVAIIATAATAKLSIFTIVGAMALIPAAIFLWVKNWEELRDGTIVIWNFLKEKSMEIFTGMKTNVTDIVTGMVSLINEQFQKIGNALAPLVEMKDKVISIFKRMSDTLVGRSIIPDMITEIGVQFKRLRAAIILPTNKTTAKVVKAFEKLKERVAGSIGALSADLVKGAINFEQFAARAIKALIKLAAQQALVGFGPGAAFVGGFIGGLFAEGGRPPKGQVSVVGEKGPELFVPDTLGTIIPTSELAITSGGGISVSQVFNITGLDFSDRRTIRRVMSEIGEEAKKGTTVAIGMFRRGGDLADKNSRRSF